ncbi:MAG: hypothetical protein ABIG85_00600 [Chloroflexota bacterium]
MKRRSRWMAGFSAVALALVMAVTAFGYAGEVAGAVTVAGPGGTIKCGVNVLVTATVVDADGKRIAYQPVAWKITTTPSPSDKVKPLSAATSATGVARANVFLACVPGSRRIRATADAVSGSAILNVTAAGLPNTSTLPASGSPDVSILGTLLAALALAAAGSFVLRQRVLGRR